jgi:hypothetical protein
LTLRLVGHVCDATGETQNAQKGFEASLAQASTLGMRPLVAHCHLGLGKLYRRTGKREQAQEHLTTATTMAGEGGGGECGAWMTVSAAVVGRAVKLWKRSMLRG